MFFIYFEYFSDNDPLLINWFVDKFRNYCNLNDKLYIGPDDFGLIVMDLEVKESFLYLFYFS